MVARSFQRGWPIICVEHRLAGRKSRWVYEDTGEPISIERPCLSCGQMPTPEGYDACIGHMPGATSICCGHGVESLYAITSRAPLCSVILVSHIGLIISIMLPEDFSSPAALEHHYAQ